MAYISVITVCRNAEKEISNTICSVLEQTYEDYEYIIVDGESTDNTLSVIADTIKNIKRTMPIIISERDNGIYDAMNKGIVLANGKWLIFLNAGDSFYNETVLQKVSGYLDSTPADIVYGDANYVENGVEYVVRAKKIESIASGMPFCHQSVFNRRKVIKDFNYNTDFKICADYDMYNRLYRAGVQFEYCDSIICNYTIGGLSQIRQKLMIKELLKIREIYWGLRFKSLRYIASVCRMYMGRLVKTVVPMEILRK
jgi:glycosyltransferase involved in cell wall biosynthesis